MLDLPFPALESLELENIPSPDSCGLQQSASVVKWNSIGATKVGRENLTRLTTRMVLVQVSVGRTSVTSYIGYSVSLSRPCPSQDMGDLRIRGWVHTANAV